MMWWTRFPPIVAAVCIAIFVITAALSVRGKSSTWDEPFHLAAGVSYLQTGDPRLNWDHPPLARLLSAIPAIFIPTDMVSEKSPTAWKSADVLNAPNGSIYDFEDRLLWASRLTMLFSSILLGILLYSWGSQLFGLKSAFLPLSLYVFCPPLLANAPIIATDLTITTLIFASIYAWWRYLKAPSKGRLLWVCLAVAAAFTAKFTALLLIPAFFALGSLSFVGNLEKSRPAFRKQAWIVGGAWLAIGIVVWLVVNIIYLFDGSFLTPPEYIVRAKYLHVNLMSGAKELNNIWLSWLPVPLPFYYTTGLLSNFAHIKNGHLTYFLGEVSNGGWPNYFIMILLIKLPLASLFLVGLGVVSAIRRLPKGAYDLLFLVLPALLLLWIASNGNLQIGIRHILPAIPFLLLLSGYIFQYKLTRWHQGLVGLLVVLAAWSSFSIYPYYLMYFNFIAGGPEQGWRISIESDDWGQGGADLKQWLQTRGIKEIAYGPFGWGESILHRAGIKTKSIPCQDTGELVAIHAGQLLKTYGLEQTLCYTWMRLREPDEKIGYSIFLYNTKNIPRPPHPANLELFNQALALQLKGEKEPAIVLYRQYLIQEPDYYQAHFNLACALMDTGQCSMAIPEFKRTLEIWPGYKEAHLHLSKCYQQLGQQDKMQWHEEEYRKK